MLPKLDECVGLLSLAWSFTRQIDATSSRGLCRLRLIPNPPAASGKRWCSATPKTRMSCWHFNQQRHGSTEGTLQESAGGILGVMDTNTARDDRVTRALVSSGRQIPTSEQRGHLGLLMSGGGAWSLAATRQRSANCLEVSAIALSSTVMVTRRRTSAYQISARVTA